MTWTRSYTLALALLSTSAHAAQSKLSTYTENREGVVEDVAGPRTFEDPTNSRIWLAEGRIRAALRMGDRVRMHDEDHLFSSGISSEQTYEKLIALEFNDTNGRLYTLTEAGLYREETAVGGYGQPNPGGQKFLDFSDPSFPQHLDSLESFQDLKLWPGTNRVFLLTTHRIIAVKDDLELDLASTSSWSLDMFPPATHQKIADTTFDLAFNSLKVNQFLRFRLFKETLPSPALKDHLIAVVLAATSGYPPAARPPMNVVLLCDLGASTSDIPVFDSDPSTASINYAYYLSAPSTPLNYSPFITRLYNVFGLDTFAGANNRSRAYPACGKTNQIKELQLEGVLPRPYAASNPLVPVATHQLPELLTTSDDDHAWNVLADDLIPEERFFVVSPSGFHTHLTALPLNQYVTSDEPFGKGCSHDMLRSNFVSMPSAEAQYDSVFTATTGSVDFICKSMNVTDNHASGIPLLANGGRTYSLFTVDGGVVLPHSYVQAPTQRDDVHISTFGGVVKFNPDANHVYRSDADAYQPAVALGMANSDVDNTEAIIAGAVGPFGFHREVIVTASAQGDFMVYPTDETQGYRPITPKKYLPRQLLMPSGWSYATDTFYSNDVAFVDLQPATANDGKYTLADLSRLSPSDGTRGIVLLAYEWKPLQSAWTHVATSTVSSAADVPFDGSLSTNITVAPNKNWFIVAHDRGFFSVKQNLASTTTPLSIVTDVLPIIGSAPVDVQGLAASDTRVFAYMNPLSGANCEIRVYAIDPTSGVITTTGFQTIPNDAFQVVPGTPVLRSFRGRFDPVPPIANETIGSGSVYFACTKYILRFAWAQGSGAPSTDTFTFKNWWGSDYGDNFTDCIPYTRTSVAGSPKALLAIKDRETFALTEATNP